MLETRNYNPKTWSKYSLRLKKIGGTFLTITRKNRVQLNYTTLSGIGIYFIALNEKNKTN